jgi:hypothetical protein
LAAWYRVGVRDAWLGAPAVAQAAPAGVVQIRCRGLSARSPWLSISSAALACTRRASVGTAAIRAWRLAARAWRLAAHMAAQAVGWDAPTGDSEFGIARREVPGGT